jgi:hypothetical protein
MKNITLDRLASFRALYRTSNAAIITDITKPIINI